MARAPDLAFDAAAPRSARSVWAPSWPLIAAALTYLYLLAHGRFLLRDGDTLSHVAIGRWILEHGAIPSADPISQTMRGTPWIAQEWLAQVVLSLSHDAGGWTLVVAVCAFAFAGAIALLTRSLLRWLEPVYALLFAAFAVLMAAGHALARPHMLAMPLLFAWTAELVLARDERRAPRLLFIPLMTSWANTHGGFTLGIALAGAFAFEALLEARHDRARLAVAVRTWGMFVALAVAAALVTPQGPRGMWLTWQVLVQYTYALDTIGEWQSPNFHAFQPLELWLLGSFALAMVQGLKLPPVRLALLLGFTHLALKHGRYVELLGLVGPLVVAAPLGTQWSERNRGKPQAASIDAFFARLAAPAGAAAVVLYVACCALLAGWVAHAKPLEFPPEIAPVKAVDAARRAGIANGPVLNGYEWGGYLAYLGIPPFIDGRSELYGDAFLKQYRDAVRLADSDGFDKLVERHHIAWTLLPAGTPAIALMDHLPGWKRVYADETAVVHARTAPASEHKP